MDHFLKINKALIIIGIILISTLGFGIQVDAITRGSDSLVLNSPKEGDTVGGAVILDWDMVDSDQSTVNYIVDIFNGQCSTNGTNLGKITKSGANQSDSNYTYSWDTSLPVNGNSLSEGASYCVRLCGFFSDPTAGFDSLCEKVSVTYSASTTSENSNPIISTTTSTFSFSEGDPIAISIQASDEEGDTLLYSLLAAPAGLEINSATGEITGVILDPGNYNVIVSVEDNNGGQDSQNFSVVYGEVTAPVTDVPVVSDTLELVSTNPEQNGSTPQRAPQLVANFSMPEGSSLNAAATNVTLNGTVDNISCVVNTNNITCDINSDLELGEHSVSLTTAIDEQESVDFGWTFTIADPIDTEDPGGTNPQEDSGNNNILIAVVVVVVGILLVAIPWGLYYFFIKKKRSNSTATNTEPNDNGGLPPTLSDDPLGLANPVAPLDPTQAGPPVIGDNQVEAAAPAIGVAQSSASQLDNLLSNDSQLSQPQDPSQGLAQAHVPAIDEYTAQFGQGADNNFTDSSLNSQQQFTQDFVQSPPPALEDTAVAPVSNSLNTPVINDGQSTVSSNPLASLDSTFTPAPQSGLVEPVENNLAPVIGDFSATSTIPNTTTEVDAPTLVSPAVADAPTFDPSGVQTSDPVIATTVSPQVTSPINDAPFEQTSNPLADLDNLGTLESQDTTGPEIVASPSPITPDTVDSVGDQSFNPINNNDNLSSNAEELQLPELYRSDDIPAWLQDNQPDVDTTKSPNPQEGFLNPVDMSEGAKVHDPFGISLNSDDTESEGGSLESSSGF